jgi:hypothetical protein
LQFVENDLAFSVIQIKRKNEAKFNVHPRLVQPSIANFCKKNHPKRKNTRQNGGWPRNNIPQAIRHDFILVLQNFLLR